MPIGHIKHFREGKFGHIAREDGQNDIIVPASKLPPGVRALLKGEPVEFDEEPGHDGRPVAANIRRLEARVTGTIESWNVQDGTGLAKSADGTITAVVYVDSILDGYRCLQRGEPVEFAVRSDGMEQEALRVLRLDPSACGNRVTGTVLEWHEERGHGVIEPDDGGSTVFIHHTGILGAGFKRLEADEPVVFTLVNGPRGPQAHDLHRLDPRKPLERFANLGRFDNHLRTLEGMAQEEPWDYQRNPRGGWPILWSYIQYTFVRLQQEGKIATVKTPDGRRSACFNTGLVTQLQQEIFAVFTENRKQFPDDPEWFLLGFYRQSDAPLHVFRQKPEVAHYWENAADLVYDYNRRLEVNVPHIIRDRSDRFPREFQAHEEMMTLFLNSMVESALRRVRRNYKTAVPQYHRGKIELLLPLALNPKDPQAVDLALVVSRENEVYKANTALRLDWAYRNARLLARPDPDWLQP